MTAPGAADSPLPLPPSRFPPALMAREISRLQPLLPARIAALEPTLNGWLLQLQGPDRAAGTLLISLAPGALGVTLWEPDDGPLPPPAVIPAPAATARWLSLFADWRLVRAFAPAREPIAVLGLGAPRSHRAAEAAAAELGPFRTLILELFGASGNLVLVGLEAEPESEEGWLSGAVLRRLYAGKGAVRSLEPGEAYRLPRTPAGESPPLASAAAVQSARGEFVAAVQARWQLRMVDKLAQPLCAEITRLHKRIGALQTQCATVADIERAQLEGQYLQSHRQRGQRGFQVIDPSADAAVWNLRAPIAVQPKLTLAENAQKRFEQAHKWRRAAEFAAATLPQLQAAADTAQMRLDALHAAESAAATWPDFLAALRPFLPVEAAPGAPPQKGSMPARAPAPAAKTMRPPAFVRRFDSSDGWTIDVGKSARDNHKLTFQSANGNDLLLHIAGVPGAHVLVRCKDRPAKSADPVFPPATLMEAARLCLHFSSRRAVAGEVVYALRKHCKPGSSPGQVYISKPQYLRVKADPAAIKLILDRRQ